MANEQTSINTAQWKKAGLPFEIWLRYAQADERTQAKVEEKFFSGYPHLKE